METLAASEKQRKKFKTNNAKTDKASTFEQAFIKSITTAFEADLDAMRTSSDFESDKIKLLVDSLNCATDIYRNDLEKDIQEEWQNSTTN